MPLCALVLSFRLELNKVDGFVDMLLFYLFIFFYLPKHSCSTTIAALSRIKRCFFYVNCLYFQINWSSAQICLSFQQPRVRNVNVPSQTSSSSGRWSGWQGVKVGSHQRTPLSDVARAATALVCGRKAPQARCDLWNKVWDLWRDHCEWECCRWKCISYFSFFLTAPHVLAALSQWGCSD